VHYECADRVIAQFVERATAKGLDTSCLLRLTTRPFILPKQASDKNEPRQEN